MHTVFAQSSLPPPPAPPSITHPKPPWAVWVLGPWHGPLSGDMLGTARLPSAICAPHSASANLAVVQQTDNSHIHRYTHIHVIHTCRLQAIAYSTFTSVKCWIAYCMWYKPRVCILVQWWLVLYWLVPIMIAHHVDCVHLRTHSLFNGMCDFECRLCFYFMLSFRQDLICHITDYMLGNEQLRTIQECCFKASVTVYLLNWPQRGDLICLWKAQSQIF